jgi:hypothetical protein
LAAGVAGFKPGVDPANDSAMLLRDWIEDDTFVWKPILIPATRRSGPAPMLVMLTLS